MLMSFLLALTIEVPSGEPYIGPPPDDPIWKTLASRAGVQPLRVPDSLRLIRFGWAEHPGTIVTVLPTAEGAQLEVAVLRNWHEAGATRRTVTLSGDQYQSLRQLTESGFWGQPPVAPTGAPGATDGRVWYIEGFRDGKRHAMVRHEPKEPHIRAVCAALMTFIGEPSLAPHR